MHLHIWINYSKADEITHTDHFQIFRPIIIDKNWPNEEQEQNKHPISSNSYPSATANKAKHRLKIGGGVQNQREPIILTKYRVHPTVVSENNSSSGMLIIYTINQTVCININLKGPHNQRHSK